MRKALVLTNETVRHPFRQQLGHKGPDLLEKLRPLGRNSNLRNFAATYVVGFIAVSLFIA